MTQKLTILFDLDGTLADTAPDLLSAHNHVMKKFGYNTKSIDEIKNYVGQGAAVMIGRSIWNTARNELSKITDKKIKDEMVNEFLDFYGKNTVVESKLINGVYKFLEWAKSNNISMGVCTNKQEHLAVDFLKKIKIYDFFEYVAGRNTFDYCKPDPRHLTSTIEIMGGDIKKSLMIGDSENDADAAKSAGIPMILLEDGYTDKNVEQIHHDHLIKNFIGLETIISSYFND
ncbi:MAG TPA: HAD-IA family hydrolase [Candidatus Pelagibacter bacterium]|jgi:phosphoglycolate phosphatase|nr:HAD family hydrolase [Pelagibacteraceae bacterium]HJN84109.1 HAD-IA family hydrolase [Candidatus Pelagibacter bacterium]|tara:strand:- start:801 stop:1490 length:690 start_codon:yes stop_codon:yes gene_type:complete